MSELDSFIVQLDDEQVVLTLVAVFGDVIQYAMTASDAALLGASLCTHAVRLSSS